jgi:hypothetical protein
MFLFMLSNSDPFYWSFVSSEGFDEVLSIAEGVRALRCKLLAANAATIRLLLFCTFCHILL